MSFKLIKPATKEGQSELLEAAMLPTGSTGFKSDAVAFGVKEGSDALSAIAIFEGFGGGEAQFHFAMIDRSPITRAHIKAFIMLAFHHNAFGLKKVWANIASSNRAAIRAALALGFDFEYRKRAGFDGTEDAIVLSMSRPMPGVVAARPQENQSAVDQQDKGY